jgi:hypothetical protein
VPLTTTAATKAGRQKGIPLGNLPSTFKDTIFLTKTLGFRYIWIDSLCIIQDSREYWSTESTRIDAIYAHAALDISASAARDAEDGIFASSNKERYSALPSATVRCFSNIHKIEGNTNIGQHTNIQPPESNLYRASCVQHVISLDQHQPSFSAPGSSKKVFSITQVAYVILSTRTSANHSLAGLGPPRKCFVSS